MGSNVLLHDQRGLGISSGMFQWIWGHFGSFKTDFGKGIRRKSPLIKISSPWISFNTSRIRLIAGWESFSCSFSAQCWYFSGKHGEEEQTKEAILAGTSHTCMPTWFNVVCRNSHLMSLCTEGSMKRHTRGAEHTSPKKARISDTASAHSLCSPTTFFCSRHRSAWVTITLRWRTCST